MKDLPPNYQGYDAREFHLHLREIAELKDRRLELVKTTIAIEDCFLKLENMRLVKGLTEKPEWQKTLDVAEEVIQKALDSLYVEIADINERVME